MIDKLTIDDVPENLKSVAYAIGIDAFKSLIKCAGGTSVYLPSERCITKPVRDRVKSLIKCAGGTSVYLPSERCITKPVRDRVIRESFCGDYREMARRFGISEVRVRRIVGEKS